MGGQEAHGAQGGGNGRLYPQFLPPSVSPPFVGVLVMVLFSGGVWKMGGLNLCF